MWRAISSLMMAKLVSAFRAAFAPLSEASQSDPSEIPSINLLLERGLKEEHGAHGGITLLLEEAHREVLEAAAAVQSARGARSQMQSASIRREPDSSKEAYPLVCSGWLAFSYRTQLQT